MELVKQLYRYGLIGGIDYEMADFCGRLAVVDSPEIRLAAALCSYRISSQNHASLNLAECAGQTIAEFFSEELLLGHDQPPDALLDITLPELEPWLNGIQQARLKMLILEHDKRLYLRRYYLYEKNICDDIMRRLAESRSENYDSLLDKYGLTGEQRQAAAMALNGGFSIITGGPGTGKTTTFAKILGIMLETAGRPLRIQLAAPTGKAAQRMQESVSAACDKLLDTNPALAQIPRQASTIHKLLGYIHNSPDFKFNRDNPLPLDILVVDECSMIPLALLAKLLAAVPPSASIIMLGDKNQLEPVEVGAAFNDICHAASRSPLKERVVQLTKSYRFDPERGIGKLSNAILHAREEDIIPQPPEVTFTQVSNRDWTRKMQQACEFFAEIRLQQDLAEAFSHFSQLRILTAGRQFFLGSQTINELIIEQHGGKIPYRGLPVMITANDYNTMLFNGDTGMIWQDDPDAPLFAAFPEPGGKFRRVNLNLLPAWVPAYAITVHKAQGSEADNIILMLPEAASRVISRELFFTGVTRAKKRVDVWYDSPAILSGKALESHSSPGGLAERLLEVMS